MLKYGDPAAICHGNPGGWQFSYRYATILLPWMFLLLAGNGPAKLSLIEVSLFAASRQEWLSALRSLEKELIERVDPHEQRSFQFATADGHNRSTCPP